MNLNLGTTDRIIRLIISLAIVILYFANFITGTLGIILLIVAGILTITSLISFCPLYRIFGISSRPKRKD